MIAFIWQKDWEDLASIIALRLIKAKHELCVYVYGGQVQSVLSDALAAAEGFAKREGDTSAKTKLPLSVAKNLKEALANADTVITLLGSERELEDVYFGDGGILQCAKPASLFVDLSASSPKLTKEIYALAAVHDHRFVEAPASGAIDYTLTGDFKLYAAGESDNLDFAMPLLQEIAGANDASDVGKVSAKSDAVIRVGLPGCGVALKLSEQIALAGAIMGMVEAYSFAAVFGCDQKSTQAVLNNSPYSAQVSKAFGKKLLDEDFYYGLDLYRFCTALEGALNAADEAELALPGLETAHQLYDLLVLVGGAKMGIHTLSLVYRDEELCAKHGLNWALAEKAMDLYERGPDGENGDYYYDEDDEDDDAEIVPPREISPGMSQYFYHN